MKTPLEKKYVHLPNGEKLWTVIANNNLSNKTPLVMVHGFGGGVGFWVSYCACFVLACVNLKLD